MEKTNAFDRFMVMLDGTLWLRVPEPEETLDSLTAFMPSHTRTKVTEHILNVHELQQIADIFEEDVPTLLSKMFHTDCRQLWQTVTDQAPYRAN